MNRRLPAIILAVTVGIATLTGGQVPADPQPLPPGVSPLIAGAMGEPNAVMFTRLLFGLGLVAALLLHDYANRVHSLPTRPIGIAFGSFMLLLVFGMAISPFRGTAFTTMADWALYGAAFLLAVDISGRKIGPQMICSALFIGCSLVALRGIQEYAEMKAIDPSWRIFAGWVNPNATAAILLIGWLLGLAVVQWQARIGKILAVLGLGVIGLAIALTQSKGGLYVAGGMTLVMLVFGAAVQKDRSKLALPGVSVAIAALLVFALTSSQKASATSAATSVLSRVTDSSGTAEQSAGFRSLLWKGAIELIQSNPVGYGLGSYRYESARPGLTTQTVYAHSSWLQLGVEASVLAPVVLMVFGVMWLAAMLKGIRTAPSDRQALRIGIIAAVLGIAVHSFVDSDLYYFGVGLAFFTLLGTGLAAATDAVGPQFVRPAARLLEVATVVTLLVSVTFVAMADTAKNRFRGVMSTGGTDLPANLEAMLNINRHDGEAYALAGQYYAAVGSPETLPALRKAAELSPSPRNYRALARAQEAEKSYAAAIDSLQRALDRDPNNMFALLQLMRVQDALGDKDSAKTTAQRLIDVEAKPYYQVRSLPEIVPTETAEARLYLANSATGETRAELLKGGLAVFENYLKTTVPAVTNILKQVPNGNFAGETGQSLDRKLKLGLQTAEDLARYRAGTAEGSEAAAAAGRFKEALASLPR